MASWPRPRRTQLLLYDGVCGLCNSLIQLVLKHDRHHVFHFASLQSEAARSALAPFNCDPEDLTTMYVVRDYRSARPLPLARGRAALFVASMLDWPWKGVALFRVLPTALINIGYNLVARYRYRLFGRYDQCLMPSPEYRERFIDESLGRRSS
jgi:predicted DCC family thiol-disulfide oxidoreductase YuxK